MRSPETFTTFQIAEKLDIKYGRLREWLIREYIKPYRKAKRQGEKTLFSKFDVYMIELFVLLTNRGFSRQDASRRTQRFANFQSARDELTTASFVAFPLGKNIVDEKGNDSKTSVIFFNNFEELGNIEDYDGVLIVNFKEIRDSVDGKLI